MMDGKHLRLLAATIFACFVSVSCSAQVRQLRQYTEVPYSFGNAKTGMTLGQAITALGKDGFKEGSETDGIVSHYRANFNCGRAYPDGQAHESCVPENMLFHKKDAAGNDYQVSLGLTRVPNRDPHLLFQNSYVWKISARVTLADRAASADTYNRLALSRYPDLKVTCPSSHSICDRGADFPSCLATNFGSDTSASLLSNVNDTWCTGIFTTYSGGYDRNHGLWITILNGDLDAAAWEWSKRMVQVRPPSVQPRF